MSNVTQIAVTDPVRRARAEYIAEQLDADGRSVRYVAGNIGINHTSLGDRLKGRVAFTAEDIEGIARVLKRDPVELYRSYITVGPEGLEPPTSSVKTRQLAIVTPLHKHVA